MKRIFALLLCLVVIAVAVFSLSSCDVDIEDTDESENDDSKKGNKNDDDIIIGSWKSNLDMTEAMNAIFDEDEEMAEYISVKNFKFDLIMTFKDDGTYTAKADEDSFEDAIDDMKESLTEGFTEYIENLASEAGMSMQDFLSHMGMSVEELIDSMFDEDMASNMCEGFQIEGKYMLKGGKLFTTEDLDDDIDESEYETYELSENELKLLKKVGGDIGEDDEFDAAMEKNYPLVFKRVK